MLKLLLLKVLDIKLSVDCVVIFLVLFKFLEIICVVCRQLEKKWNRAWLLFVHSLGCLFWYSESISENYFVEIFGRKWIRNVKVENPGFCQHEVDLETYVLIGERSWTCTQSTITLGVHLTFKIAGLKKVAVSKVLENLDKPDKCCCVKGVRKP